MVQAVHDGQRCRHPDQHHQDRDADHGPQLAGAADHGGGGGVARTLGQTGQRSAPEDRQGGPDPDALEQLPGQPLAEERRSGADPLEVPEQAAGPDQRAGYGDQPVPALVGDLAEHRGDHGRHERGRGDRQTRPEQGVVPDVVQPEHVGEQVGVEPGPGDHRRHVADDEGPRAQQRRIDQRRGVGSRGEDEPQGREDRRPERAEHPSVGPAPVGALDQPEGEQSEGGGQQAGATEIGHPPLARGAALHQPLAGHHDRDQAQREVDQKGQSPTRGVDECAADRRAQPGGDRCGRTPQRDPVGASLRVEPLHHQGQRGRHQHGGADPLQHPEGDQLLDGGSHCAEHRGQGEHPHPEHEDPTPTEQVRDPSRRHQERREDDVVGVEHPAQGPDRGLRERPLDVGKRDVDDRRVEEGQEGTEGGDQQHRHRGRLPPLGQPRTDHRQHPGGQLDAGRRRVDRARRVGGRRDTGQDGATGATGPDPPLIRTPMAAVGGR